MMSQELLPRDRSVRGVAVGVPTDGPGMRLKVAGLSFILLTMTMLTAGALQSVAAAEITDQNVDEMVASAKTAEDHEALAAYFRSKSAAAAENIKMHERMRDSFRGKPSSQAAWKSHCTNLIRTFRTQQEDYSMLAKEQETVAKTLGGAHK